ncbi:MAG: beta-lactamase family protein [Alphaproteobacteria bacterium]|nr:beta-lactamase family protein [Alphaproteobacteria bacterium]
MTIDPAARKQKIDETFKRAVDNGDVPGIVAMATGCDDIIYEGAFGKRVLGDPAPMTLDTVMWIASMTKPLTTAAALQLVERGKLQLDTPAARVIPEIANAQVLEGFNADGTPRTRPPARQITLRHLLTHTAGFGYDMWSADLVRYQDAMGIPGIVSCRNSALTTPLLFDPGERWFYGISIDWAGKMVEAASGKQLGEYFHENILAPLGMTSTAFTINGDMRARLAKIHQRGGDGALSPLMEFEVPQDPDFEMGGGGLYSTAGDFLKFCRMILNQGSHGGLRLLESETVALMSTNNIGGNRVCGLKTAIPSLTNDAEFFPGLPKTWGFGFQINEEPLPTGRPAGGLMWAGLANTYFWIDPQSAVSGVYLTQILPFADKKSAPLYIEFETAFYS